MTAQVDAGLRQRVFDGMRGILPRVLDRELPEVTDSTGLMDELGLRSATTLELLLELEDSLDIQIEVEDIDQADLKSVGDLADYVASHAVTDG